MATKRNPHRTRLDELREIPSPWDYATIAHAMGVDVDTARRWAHEGRKARDLVLAECYRVSLDTVRKWRRTGVWAQKAAAVNLEGVGVGFHALPEATHRLGGSDGWDRESVIAWGRTSFDESGRTRLTETGEATQLVPTGRPPGIQETVPRPPRRPERAKERDMVIKMYKRLAGKGVPDTEIRTRIVERFGISRKQVSRYLVEARRDPERYGEIPQASPARGTRRQQENRKLRMELQERKRSA